MAYQMIHMEVAYRLLKIWNRVRDPAEFILGSVAPDSVHMAKDYAVERKIRSHLFEGCGEWSNTQDYERWNSNILNFWGKFGKEAETSKEQAFILGVCVHCFTDYYNDLNIWRKLQGRYVPPMTLEQFREAYYPEARGIDRWLYQHSSHTEEIRNLLEAGQPYCLCGILQTEQIERQKYHLLYEQYEGEKEDISGYRFLSAEKIEEFVETTVSKIHGKGMTDGIR